MPPPPKPPSAPARPARTAANSAPPRSAKPPGATAATSVVATWPKWKRYTVTGLFATAIISGAIWGASLKMQQEAKAENKKALEATVHERVLILEQRKEYLMQQKAEIQSKIDGLNARMKARESGLSGR
ncbi:hypothetical protein B0T16DRAFT_316089 [Cercophora newfieldiana]|uniref:Uncharacterized protein n=1 Tax=Cercophora newfieldiana TaxID=92897 RepID=A0AA39YMB4_9PEZI|nr:hypothetical protein B0T16DRAFT_316089 [Cercophora newfieldiana]